MQNTSGMHSSRSIHAQNAVFCHGGKIATSRGAARVRGHGSDLEESRTRENAFSVQLSKSGCVYDVGGCDTTPPTHAPPALR